MLYDEKEVIEICNKYVIETVEKKGYPIYQGKEMDENFSIVDIMHEPIRIRNNILDKVLVYAKYLKRKVKLKGELCVIGSKILFLGVKYWLCQAEIMIIDCKEWVYMKVCDLIDRVLGIYE